MIIQSVWFIPPYSHHFITIVQQLRFRYSELTLKYYEYDITKLVKPNNTNFPNFRIGFKTIVSTICVNKISYTCIDRIENVYPIGYHINMLYLASAVFYAGFVGEGLENKLIHRRHKFRFERIKKELFSVIIV